MSQPANLTCIFFSDLNEWEKLGPRAVIEGLSKHINVSTINADESCRGLLTKTKGPVWILSRDWKGALKFLGGATRSHKVFVSLFEAAAPHPNAATLILQRFKRAIPRGVTLIAHCPLVHRFHKEFDRLKDSELFYLPFPALSSSVVSSGSLVRAAGDPVTIGTLAPFTTASNLNFFLSIAHYVSHRRPEARFRILGSGPLYRHIGQLIVELGLEESVSVTETFSFTELGALDISLYVPLRNEHFISLLAAAATGIPVLASTVPGVEQMISDGQDGFLFGANDTRPLAELILRLIDDEILRRGMGEKLKRAIEQKFAPEKVVAEYLARCFSTVPKSAAVAA